MEDTDEDHSANENNSIDEKYPVKEDHPVEETPPGEPQIKRHSFFKRPIDILFGPFQNLAFPFENPLWNTLPPAVAIGTTSSDNITVLLEDLLAQESLEDIEDLCEEDPSLRKVFDNNKAQVLRKHIAPEAWADAICCVDRRLQHLGKAAREAFDRDYADGTVADYPPPQDGTARGGTASAAGSSSSSRSIFSFSFSSLGGNRAQKTKKPQPTDRGQWDLNDLCNLVKVINKLLDRISECQKLYASLEEWENSWQDRRPDDFPEDWGPEGEEIRPQFIRLCKDNGTEDPMHFAYAFERHTAFDERGPLYEGVDLTEGTPTNRAKLQRAFFRLEFMRRAFYQRPFFPRGAKWQNRTATMTEGRVRGAAGETYATRLARADKMFKRWTPDDFIEVICAFKATLNEYAVPIRDLLQDFHTNIEYYRNCEDQDRFHDACGTRGEQLEDNGRAIGLQWEQDPFHLEERLVPMWDIEPSDDFYSLRAQLLDDRADGKRLAAECFPAPLARAEFDEWHSTIYRSERVRFAPRNKREREDPAQRVSAKEAHPVLAMSRFLHVLCSLPLAFLDEFLAMPTHDKHSFLRSSYWAVARVKASRAPSFLSGEMRAWCSKPAAAAATAAVDHDEDGDPDRGNRPRLFPELSVRAASIGCVAKVYEYIENHYLGFRIATYPEEQGGWCKWWWDDVRLPALVWDELHWELTSETVRINHVFRMSDVQWRQVWRSDREFERQVWTGRAMDREVWEGYGAADPNGCYCHWGGGCGICVPLPEVELPEWELMTPAEVLEESNLMGFMREPWSKLPELEEAVLEYVGTVGVVPIQYEESI
ncbi:hypothetical protein CORC01_01830 [Colletotrichum orchidophilum]|uniref:Uncharacterized protein n=1 Tax=Colletotrichum orchidophilum TaxID=1209926 RepID=A0A1G4BMP3_9PEZI|nr:uncharacterized protein CORC01_01830 [Colletotrichum orchidophilum]OHF02729.1 hypothetical protein CORC01_01830 [Colletotrichum orchidophilum]